MRPRGKSNEALNITATANNCTSRVVAIPLRKRVDQEGPRRREVLSTAECVRTSTAVGCCSVDVAGVCRPSGGECALPQLGLVLKSPLAIHGLVN